ncbi:GNAT family N-acetyltransferase [Actinoplanes solisilvae]|uniref:GNAT family N-acetyltransferase n=1 Tax=Actinoplanes solisilvae TaxID=2486853 RepID=UPI000FD735DE|nr:GNAT family N-acetyltransferase [Actinoplanes solisilvae]
MVRAGTGEFLAAGSLDEWMEARQTGGVDAGIAYERRYGRLPDAAFPQPSPTWTHRSSRSTATSSSACGGGAALSSAGRDNQQVMLVPFTAELLPTVQVWFEDAEVRRWLGGPDWPAQSLRMHGQGLGEEFRGRRVLRDHSWVALDDDGEPVGLIGGEVYDHWDETAGPAMGLAYVVDPRRWRQGYGAAMLRAVVGSDEVADVVVFAAGIEPENKASVRCAVAAGFRPENGEPDHEGIVHHLLRRNPGDQDARLG